MDTKEVEGELVRRGPPTLYKPEMCDTIVEIAAQGGHISAMILAIGVKSRETWYRWRREHPEFNRAAEFAEEVSQDFYERLMLKGLTGEIPNFNATLCALLMNNKFGRDYKRTGGGGDMNVTYNTINYTPEQINQRIAQKLEKLKLLGVDLHGDGSE